MEKTKRFNINDLPDDIREEINSQRLFNKIYNLQQEKSHCINGIYAMAIFIIIAWFDSHNAIAFILASILLCMVAYYFVLRWRINKIYSQKFFNDKSQ